MALAAIQYRLSNKLELTLVRRMYQVPNNLCLLESVPGNRALSSLEGARHARVHVLKRASLIALCLKILSPLQQGPLVGTSHTLGSCRESFLIRGLEIGEIIPFPFFETYFRFLGSYEHNFP